MPLRLLGRAALFLLGVSTATGKTVVFWQPDFPTAESQPVSREVLEHCFPGAVFVDIEALQDPNSLSAPDLLVLPYGSAFPADAWRQIQEFLKVGGNLLNIGGRVFFTPVFFENGVFKAKPLQNTYVQALGIRDSYTAPQTAFAGFAWDENQDFRPSVIVAAQRAFVLQGAGRGAGFLLNSADERVAAALTVKDASGRVVLLPFDPVEGYWSSRDGEHLLSQAWQIAQQKPLSFWLETQNATVAEGEIPQVTVHLRAPNAGVVHVELSFEKKILATSSLKYHGGQMAATVVFQPQPSRGLFTVRGAYIEDDRTVAEYRTGFWQRDSKLLEAGGRMTAGRDYFSVNGAPFVPFGVNYFSSDPHTGFFVGGNPAGNAYLWDRDFAEMERHHIKMVRTGIWMNRAEYLDRATGAVSERLLRALEAFLYSAGRHRIQVQFTFFAFDPQTVRGPEGRKAATLGPGSNPYTDPEAIEAQRLYVVSIASRFHDVPYLSWDLINEPTFSNPSRHFAGNIPNGDATELSAWNRWLEARYGSAAKLAEAWGVPEDRIETFGSISLPGAGDLSASRDGSSRALRAIDYNLFAQDEFGNWVRQMIGAIRGAGSKGLITVGQDEGGVTNRVLNQFTGSAGIDFTVNHSWWRNDALLWDSIAAKRPDMPNLIGETGVQPVGRMDDSARQNEITAYGLEERKLALAFAAANSGGALHWAWEADHDFGLTRGDGSAKSWRDLVSGIGAFAEQASAYLTEAKTPEIAVVLPQSLQLSTHNGLALEAQQKCVRALFHYARASAYAVGEYQLNLLGNPKLIVVPSPWVFSEPAWNVLIEKARSGATVLVSGRLDLDEHFHPTARSALLKMNYTAGPLVTRENPVEWPGGQGWFTFGGDKTDLLDRGFLGSGATYVNTPVGQGKLLYFPLPLELSDNLQAIGDVYRFAIKEAGISPVFVTDLNDPGILIAPTQLDKGTLYVLTSESSSHETFSFRDSASGKEFRGSLAPGRAALLLITKDGTVAASYNWRP